MTDEVWEEIRAKLEKRWSPEQIERWLKEEYDDTVMSAKTIYNYIHFHLKGELKKAALQDLRQKGKARRKEG